MEYENLDLEIFPSVYEPAEDSFLLAKHAKNLTGRILEIGCGCGIVSLTNAKANPENEVVGVDIDPEAVECAKKNAAVNKIKNAKFFVSDLFSSVPKNRKFDAILFNPPYLPTTKSERLRGKINAVFDGGKDGRAVLDRFLEDFDHYLKHDGILILIQSSLNDLEKTRKKIEKKGYEIDILEEDAYFFERLYALRIKNLTPSL